jgi:tRNA U34 5-carboxymethylaminomethyl modifying GTPase MnmE/TrmE
MKNIIAALSTPSGKGGVGIIRMSGAGCLKIASEIFESKTKIRHAVMNFGRIDADGIRDACYMVYFESPRSFTGEDTVEFHCHGGEALTEGVLRALYSRGAAPAMRGEFTKRAYLNGKLTLSDAEGVAEVINAENAAAVKAGYRLMSGFLSREIYSIQDDLLSIIAALEASLDYPDEIDITPFAADQNASDKNNTARQIVAESGETDIISNALNPNNINTNAVAKPALNLDGIISRLDALLLSAKKTNLVKRGINIALIGKPNAGKSSLLNRFTGKDRAIVTEVAGTTRDTLEECLEFDGLRLNFVDTAGLRSQTNDPIEKKGVERSFSAAKGADIIFYVVDAESFDGETEAADFNALKAALFPSEISNFAPPPSANVSFEISNSSPKNPANISSEIIIVLNKNDIINDGIDPRNPTELNPQNDDIISQNSPPWEGRRGGATESIDPSLRAAFQRPANEAISTLSHAQNDGIDPRKNAFLEGVENTFKGHEIFSVSALTGDGIDALLSTVVSRFKGTNDGGAEISVNLRHADAVKSALTSVKSAKQSFRQTECALVDLRNAFDALGEITGQTATEDVIDAIFEKFCLGK